MTSVITLHLLVGSLALLMFVEARTTQRRARIQRDRQMTMAEEFDFRADLLVRWDDEMSGAYPRCLRSPIAEVRTTRRRRGRRRLRASARVGNELA